MTLGTGGVEENATHSGFMMNFYPEPAQAREHTLKLFLASGRPPDGRHSASIATHVDVLLYQSEYQASSSRGPGT
jgi:hypothetical protein